MPNTKGPLFSLDARGSLAHLLSFQASPGGPRVISYPDHADARTPAQLAARDTFRNAVDFWHVLTDTEKADFAAQAKGTPLTGYNLFIRACMLGEVPVDPIACAAYNAAPIVIVPNGYRLLTFDSEFFDTDNIHELGDGGWKVTCRTPGYYLAIFGGLWESSPVGDRRHRIEGSVGYLCESRIPACTTGTTAFVLVSPLFRWELDEILYCRVYQNSGGDLNLQRSGKHSPVLSVHRVR